MSDARDAFLERVRKALKADSRPGSAGPIPPRGKIGYQGAEGDLAARFCSELAVAGGLAHVVLDREGAIVRARELIQEKSARRILLGRGAFLDSLDLPDRLRSQGLEIKVVDQLSDSTCRDSFFAAELSISGVDYLIAETGTVVLLTRPEEPRSLSLLPPIHIAIAERGQLLPDLFDLFELPLWPEWGGPPSCLTLITGPSKTGDIELRLVTGVHGPGELHVILVGSQ